MNTHRNILIGLAIGLSLSASPIWAAEGQTAEILPIELTPEASATATTTAVVEAVNMETREVTLRREDGLVLTFVAGDHVRNLEHVQVGDHVITEYKVGLITSLTPAAEAGIRKRVDTLAVGRAEPGYKPAGVVEKTIEATGTVKAIDMDNRMVTIQGPTRTVMLPVSEEIDLANVKVGDQVNATFRESLAISVIPAPMPAAGEASPPAGESQPAEAPQPEQKPE